MWISYFSCWYSVIFGSAETRKDIVRCGNVAVKRTRSPCFELIYNGANPRDMADTVTVAEIENWKKRVGKKEGDIFLVNTARLEYQKAQDDVIRALLVLPEHIKFLIVGGGTDEEMG